MHILEKTSSDVKRTLKFVLYDCFHCAGKHFASIGMDTDIK